MKQLCMLGVVSAAMCAACALPTVDASPQQDQGTVETNIDWRQEEKGILADDVQLTFSTQFVKAGEAYFSPDDSKIIFQAVEVPKDPNEKPAEFYAMFVADVKRDSKGLIAGIENVKRLSPPDTANTCGWFNPKDPNIVLFGCTLTHPTESAPPGFQGKSDRYRWAFPKEMRIVECDLRHADSTANSLKVLVGDGKAYHAEGSWSPDGRFILYCSRESNDGDLFVLDTKTGMTTCLVSAKGYDGGPFFAPDGKRICYRSDRRNNGELQIMVADLAFNDDGGIVGIEREYQLTDDNNTNWCPYFTKDGRHLVYASSQLSHFNYEIFLCDSDSGNLPGSTGTIRYGLAQTRITHADHADVLPVFSHDGTWMMWTSQRHADHSSQLWAARFVYPLDGSVAAQPVEGKVDVVYAEDPESGLYYYRDENGQVRAYDVTTHQTRAVTDAAEIEKAKDLLAAKQLN